MKKEDTEQIYMFKSEMYDFAKLVVQSISPDWFTQDPDYPRQVVWNNPNVNLNALKDCSVYVKDITGRFKISDTVRSTWCWIHSDTGPRFKSFKSKLIIRAETSNIGYFNVYDFRTERLVARLGRSELIDLFFNASSRATCEILDCLMDDPGLEAVYRDARLLSRDYLSATLWKWLYNSCKLYIDGDEPANVAAASVVDGDEPAVDDEEED